MWHFQHKKKTVFFCDTIVIYIATKNNKLLHSMHVNYSQLPKPVGHVSTLKCIILCNIMVWVIRKLISNYPLSSYTYLAVKFGLGQSQCIGYSHFDMWALSVLFFLDIAKKIPILIFSATSEGEMVKWERLQLNPFVYRSVYIAVI